MPPYETPWNGSPAPWLAMLAIVGQVVLLASAWLLPFVSEYSVVGDNISELVLGRGGFLQTAAFFISGVTTLGLALVLWHFTASSRGGRFGVLLVGVYGAGAILAALFPTDPVAGVVDLAALSTTGTIHVVVALVSFLAIVLGMVLLTWSFRRQARWGSHLLWLGLLTASAFSLLWVQTQGPLAGLLQRLLVTAISLWLVLVALRVRSAAVSSG